jgi:tRNA(Ile)-lysidine synthase
MVETRRLTELSAGLRDRIEIPIGDLVVALSGGADSAALAFLLSGSGRTFRAVHVNHGLPDSPSLEAAARAVAAKVGVDLAVVVIDIPGGASPEGQARDARYSALVEQLMPGEWLLTGHTLDDQSETVLMNLIRGTGPRGLSGIPPRRGMVARPMLAVRRAETRELAGLADLPYFDDPVNLDPSVRRNSIRLEVLPALSSRFNPRLAESMARIAQLTRADDSLLSEEAGSIPVLVRGKSVAVALGALTTVPRPVADRVLRDCLGRVRPPHRGTAAEVDKIWAVAVGDRSSAVLADKCHVSVQGPLLVFSPDDDGPHPVHVPVGLVVGTQSIGGFEVVVELVDRVCRVAPLGSWSAIFAPEAELTARIDESGVLSVEADGEPAWLPGRRRLGVAWYQPGTNGYLSVFAREESGWTSSP